MKLVKLSVAAAMAAGLATSASAVELTEAIKGVDINGYVRYRMESVGGDAPRAATNNEHRYKIRVGATIPVNDDVNFKTTMGNFGAYAGNNYVGQGTSGTITNDLVYGNTNWGIIHAYFQYTGVENLVVQAGKQPMPTPFNDEEHGNGLVALYNAGPVTLAGGYFDSQNAASPRTKYNIATERYDDFGTNIMAVGVIGSVEMLNFSAWYADHEDTFNAYTVDVNADVLDMLNVGLRHTQLKTESDSALARANPVTNLREDVKNQLTKLYASADIDMFNVRGAYVRTGTEGGFVAYDTAADTAFELEQLGIGNGLNEAKMTAYHLGAGATMCAFTAGIDYARATQKANVYNGLKGKSKSSEIMPSVTYQMSDNFYVKALYSRLTDKYVTDKYEGKKDKRNLSRVEVKYSF